MMRTKQRRWIVALLALFFALGISAVPAKRGVWRDLTLTNGKMVRAQLVGDEWFHYYADANGFAYIEKKDGKYKKVSKRKLAKMRKQNEARRNPNRQRR